MSDSTIGGGSGSPRHDRGQRLAAAVYREELQREMARTSAGEPIDVVAARNRAVMRLSSSSAARLALARSIVEEVVPDA